ncbi:MAG: hypothetical protein SOH81_11830 [Acetobacter sp.]|jgi:hypothetical protein
MNTSFGAVIITADQRDGWFFSSSRTMRAARSRNSGGKRFDLLLMKSSYLTSLSVSTKPGAVQFSNSGEINQPVNGSKQMTVWYMLL